MAKGEIRVDTEKKLYVGYGEFQPVGFSLNNEELVNKLGYNLKEDAVDPNYVDDKDGVERVRIDTFIKEVKTGYTTKKAYWIYKQDSLSSSGKTQYVNQVGDSKWVESEDKLPLNFTHFLDKNTKEPTAPKKYRVAMKGEGDFMDFVRKWLHLNYFSPKTNILLNLDNFFNGNFKELNEELKEDYSGTVVEMLTVRSKDDKQYQGVWKTTMSKNSMKFIRTAKFTPDNIENWAAREELKRQKKGGEWMADYQKVAFEMTHGDYRCTDYFELTPFKAYNPDDNPVSSDSAKLPEEEEVGSYAGDEDDAGY